MDIKCSKTSSRNGKRDYSSTLILGSTMSYCHKSVTVVNCTDRTAVYGKKSNYSALPK